MLRHSLRAAGRAACLLVAGLALMGCPPKPPVTGPNEDIAQEWVRLVIQAAAEDAQAPTAEARTFFHVGIAMYDAWAAYDATATGYLTGNTLKQTVAANDKLAKQVEAVSHAVYRVAAARFADLGAQPAGSAGQVAFAAFAKKMKDLGYVDASGQPVTSDAQAVGMQVGDGVLAFAATDNANRETSGQNTTLRTGATPPGPETKAMGPDRGHRPKSAMKL